MPLVKAELCILSLETKNNKSILNKERHDLMLLPVFLNVGAPLAHKATQ